jgi:hypothetical protein
MYLPIDCPVVGLRAGRMERVVPWAARPGPARAPLPGTRTLARHAHRCSAYYGSEFAEASYSFHFHQLTRQVREFRGDASFHIDAGGRVLSEEVWVGASIVITPRTRTDSPVTPAQDSDAEFDQHG